MKVKSKDTADGYIEIEASATAAEVGREFDRAQLAFLQSMKARPKPGQSVQEAAKEQLGLNNLDAVVASQVVDRLVPFALDRLNISPAVYPQAECEVMPKRGKALSFSIRVMPKPEYELDSYAPVELVVEPFEFDESEADEELSKRLERFIEFVPAEAHPVGLHDSCFISMKARVDGSDEPRLTTEGRVYSLSKGFMPEQFDKGLIGMEPGQTRTISFDGPKMGGGGGTAFYECEVTLIELREKRIPRLADAWVKENIDGCSTVEEFRKRTYEASRRQQKADYDRRIRERVVAQFSENFNADVPEELFDHTYNAVLDNLKATVRFGGQDFLEYVKEQGGVEQVDIAITERARQALAQDFSLDALFRHNNLKIEEADYLAAAADIDPIDPAGMRKSLEACGKGFVLREVAARHAASRWLVENSTIAVKSDS